VAHRGIIIYNQDASSRRSTLTDQCHMFFDAHPDRSESFE
jgi:hypothetical protein